MKTCTGCKQNKPLTDFWKMKLGKDGRQARCISCMTVEQRAYQQAKKEELHELLGARCIKCGYSGPALQIDHIQNDRHIEREGNHGYGISKIYKAVKANQDRFQLLCANCNWEKRLDKSSEMC